MANDERSAASKYRERVRNHPDTAAFREHIERAFSAADPQVAYSVKRDLKTMTNMPFYGIKLVKPKMTYDRKTLVYNYAQFLLAYDDTAFSIKLLGWLNRNQNQTLRKAAPRRGKASDVWEHVIPSSFVVTEILAMLEAGSLDGLERLLDLYERAGQVGVTREQDRQLSIYRASMPDGWDWRRPAADPFARHRAVGILPAEDTF